MIISVVNVFFLLQPIPGLESRPDRILVSDTLSVLSAELKGDGHVYRVRYLYHIMYHRLQNILWSSYKSFRGLHGSSCVHDCGPHASCRCGVCVAIGDNNACLLPECEECSASKFIFLIVLLVLLILCFCHIVYAILQILTTTTYDAHQRVATCFGIHCCLLNQTLYVPGPRSRRRRTCMTRI